MHPITIPADWPHREASRLIASRPHLWHVQEMGEGPVLLLLHGAGGATHSWRSLMPLLAAQYHVVAPDLPGQGFTRMSSRSRCGLDPMAADLARLCLDRGWKPKAVIGHSAGAAIALRLAEILPEQPRAVVGINAALGSFQGVAGWLFPILARILALNPLVPRLFSKFSGTERRVRDLLQSTGSTIDAAGLAQYLSLVRNHGHVDATLAMMAQWRLEGLLSRLPKLPVPCLMITAANDRAVPPEVSEHVAIRMPDAASVRISGYGHLVHEEDAVRVAGVILPFLAEKLAR